MPLGKPAAVYQFKTFRELNNIDMEALQSDIVQGSFYTPTPAHNIEDLDVQYTMLEGILDSQAWRKNKQIIVQSYQAQCHTSLYWCQVNLLL